MKRLSIILALIAVSCFSAAAQAPPDKAGSSGDSAVRDTLIKMTKDWIDAEGKRDGAALDRLLADDFTGVGPSGRVTKKMIVPDPKGPGGGFNFTGGDYVANIYGDMGIVFGNGTWKAPDTGTLCFTLAFVKRGDRWQIVTIHLSKVPEQQ